MIQINQNKAEINYVESQSFSYQIQYWVKKAKLCKKKLEPQLVVYSKKK